MSTSMDKLAKELKAQMTASDDRKPKPYDAQAEVLRVEDGIAWVHIPGGVDETPVRLTINAKKGDAVNIHVANGSAWITGNTTRPPTDDAEAIVAQGAANKAVKIGEKALDDTVRAMSAAEMAETEAQRAGEAASIAGQAANQAVDTANYLDQAVYGTIIYEYNNNGTIETVYKRDDGTYYYLNNGVEVTVAESDLERDSETGQLVTDREKDGLDTTIEQAQEWADEAHTLAEQAQVSANDAQTSADKAYGYATSAYNQLADIEKVVDVLEWTAQHGIYTLSEDTEAQADKYYFSVASASLTADTAINSSKVYYTRSGTSPDYVYTAVENPVASALGTYYEVDFSIIQTPTGNPNDQKYYCISGVDEAITQYVSTHLALTDDGLWVQVDNSSSKIQITGSGVYLWNTGKRIAQYTNEVVLGDIDDVHIVLSPTNGLEFYQGTSKVAWITANTMHIQQAEIESNLRIGQFLWKVQSANRISLVYAPQ